MSESSREEFCEECGSKLARIYTVPQYTIEGIQYTHDDNATRWGYMEHKKKIEKEFAEKKAKGIPVGEVKIPKGYPSEFIPDVK